MSKDKKYWVVYHIKEWIDDRTTLLKIILKSSPFKGQMYISEYETFKWNWKDDREHGNILRTYSTLEDCFQKNVDMFLGSEVYRNE